MGFITITTSIAIYGHEFNLQGSLIAASVMYWIALTMAVLVVAVVPWAMMTKHSHSNEGLTAAWLLPFGE